MKKLEGKPKVKRIITKIVPVVGRFTREEANQIRDAIAKSGTSRSDFVRSSLLASAEAINFMGKQGTGG